MRSAKSNVELARKLQVFPALSARSRPPPGPEAPAMTMSGLPGNTTRSCSWIASDRICGLSVISVQVGDESNQLIVFQIPPLLAPRYMTLELLGFGAATSMRPANGPLTGAGPMGVHALALKTTDGEMPLLAWSTGRPTMNSRAIDKPIQIVQLRVTKPVRECLGGKSIRVAPLSFCRRSCNERENTERRASLIDSSNPQRPVARGHKPKAQVAAAMDVPPSCGERWLLD